VEIYTDDIINTYSWYSANCLCRFYCVLQNCKQTAVN